jgi:hypothetical protein
LEQLYVRIGEHYPRATGIFYGEFGFAILASNAADGSG